MSSRNVLRMPLFTEDALYTISVVSIHPNRLQSRRAKFSLTHRCVQAAFYGYIVAVYLVTYLGGAGYHMDQLDEDHVARFTKVCTCATAHCAVIDILINSS